MLRFDKLLKRQVSAHPIFTSFLLFGYIISILLISLGTTNIVQLQQMALERSEGTPPNALEVTFVLNEKHDFNDLLEIFNNTSNNTGLIFTDMSTYIDDAEKDKRFSISAELYNSQPNWSYPLLKGQYYSVEDIRLGKKVVLLGKDLGKYVVDNQGKDIITIGGEEYEVIGYIGRENTATPWDSRIIMPFSSIPQQNKAYFEDNNPVNFLLYNPEKVPMEDLYLIEDTILNINSEALINARELAVNNDSITNLITNSDALSILAILIYIVALINSVNITSFWINDRKYEIGIRKAFGHSNFQIASLLYSEMFVLSLTACVLSLIIQFLLNIFMGEISNYPTDISTQNFIVGIAVTVLTALITSAMPIIKSLKIQPIEVLKN